MAANSSLFVKEKTPFQRIYGGVVFRPYYPRRCRRLLFRQPRRCRKRGWSLFFTHTAPFYFVDSVLQPQLPTSTTSSKRSAMKSSRTSAAAGRVVTANESPRHRKSLIIMIWIMFSSFPSKLFANFSF